MGIEDNSGWKGPADFQLAAIEKFEEPQGVLIFLLGGLVKKTGNLQISFLASPAGKKIVASASLGFRGKRDEQVVGRPALAKFHRHLLSGGLFFDGDGLGPAFTGRPTDDVLKMGRNNVKFDDGKKFVFIILEDLREEFVAVPVTHTLFAYACFHGNLLF
jgi:hypothetical protein